MVGLGVPRAFFLAFFFLIYIYIYTFTYISITWWMVELLNLSGWTLNLPGWTKGKLYWKCQNRKGHLFRKKSGWWFQFNWYVYCHTENWGRWTHFDDRVFFKGGWNHQLEICSPRKPPGPTLSTRWRSSSRPWTFRVMVRLIFRTGLTFGFHGPLPYGQSTWHSPQKVG